ncbi:hypothetical protein OKW40_004079 [Paraburkholderia sp. RAU6.4a]|uniref:hypothetical protein n=1 Tax=Paraburkholderia sp. RAU6.4a TaxID=2991067 RepID=UPI003D20C342
MSHNPILLINSGNDAAEINMGEVITTHSDGLLFRLEPRARHSTPPRDVVVRFPPEKVSECYCMQMAGRGTTILHVPSAYRAQLLRFLDEHPQTLLDFKALILTATPEDESQHAAVDTIQALERLGMSRTQPRIAFLQCDEGESVESTFKSVCESLPSGSYPNVTVEARLRATPIFEKAKRAQISVSNILSGKDDYLSAIDRARREHADAEVLCQLAQKLLAQRALHGLLPEINRLVGALRIPGSELPNERGYPHETLAQE